MEIKNYVAQDDQGNILPGAVCRVYIAGTSTLADPLIDVNGNPLGNPFDAGPNGLVQFGAEDGEYDLFITWGGRSQRIRVQCLDEAGVARASDLANYVESAALEDAADPELGAVMVGRGVVALGSIVDLLAVPAGVRRSDLRFEVRGYHAGTDIGGGAFYWDAGRAKSEHNGGTVISPTVPWDGTQGGLPDFISGAGETDPLGSGVWVRVSVENPNMADNFKIDGPLIGRMPTYGPNPWTVSGSGSASTAGGSLVGDGGNVYCINNVGVLPWEIIGVFESSSPTFQATISSVKNFPGSGFGDMWHVNLNVLAGSGTIRGSYWEGGAVDQSTQMVARSQPATFSPNVRYRFRVIIDGDWSVASIESLAGEVLYTAAFYDPSISSVIGPYVFWQIHTGAVIKWHEVSAREKPTTNGRDYASFRSGLEDTPIGLNRPSAIAAASFHLTNGREPRGELFSVYNGSGAQSVFYSDNVPRVRLKALQSGFQQSLDFEQAGGAVSRIYSAGNANDVRIETGGSDKLVIPSSNLSPPYFSGSHIRVGGASGPTVFGNRVSSDRGDSSIAWNWNSDDPVQIFNTPLTAERTLSFVGSPISGVRLRVVRTASATGASGLNIGTAPITTLAAGQWCEVDYNGSEWVLTASGDL